MGLGSVPTILSGFESWNMAGCWVKVGVAGLFVRMTWCHQAVSWGFGLVSDCVGDASGFLGWLAGLRF